MCPLEMLPRPAIPDHEEFLWIGELLPAGDAAQ